MFNFSDKGCPRKPRRGQTVKGSCSRLSRAYSPQSHGQHFHPFAEKLPHCDRRILVTNSLACSVRPKYAAAASRLSRSYSP